MPFSNRLSQVEAMTSIKYRRMWVDEIPAAIRGAVLLRDSQISMYEIDILYSREPRGTFLTYTEPWAMHVDLHLQPGSAYIETTTDQVPVFALRVDRDGFTQFRAHPGPLYERLYAICTGNWWKELEIHVQAP